MQRTPSQTEKTVFDPLGVKERILVDKRLALIATSAFCALLATADDQRTGHFVGKDQPREVDGIARPGRILVSTMDSDEFVVIDAQSTSRFKTPLHIHHQHHEAIYVLSGTSRVTVGDETWEVAEGDFVFMP
jgi:mannose-6-phosphate isomerase-like protein (cupin superfamily)